jgi:hypothetical protein
MANDLSLQTGQDLLLAAAPGAELFCASGCVRVTWAGVALPVRVLPAGQGLRVPAGCVLLVTGLEPSRCRWTTAPQQTDDEVPPNANSPRPWGRGLLTGH